MAFWNSEKLRHELAGGGIIYPYEPVGICHGAYELSMGPEYFLTSTEPPVKKTLDKNQQFSLPPGQFALLLTEETVTIPKSAIALISIKAGIKFSGLVNVSGFHVDPGFSGRLKFAVYNAGSRHIVLTRGRRMFPIWFADLNASTQDVYSGNSQNQTTISQEDVMKLQGEVASPASLQDQINNLRNDLDKRFGELKTILSVISVFALTILARYLFFK